MGRGLVETRESPVYVMRGREREREREQVAVEDSVSQLLAVPGAARLTCQPIAGNVIDLEDTVHRKFGY